MSGWRWVITSLWLSGSGRSFLYSSVYSCHLFLVSSASVRSIPFLSFIVPIFAWNFPLVSLFIYFFKFYFIFKLYIIVLVLPNIKMNNFIFKYCFTSKCLDCCICIVFYGSDGKEPACQCRRHKRPGFNPWVWKIPREGNGNSPQYSFLENPMDRGAWQTTVHGITKSQTWLSN